MSKPEPAKPVRPFRNLLIGFLTPAAIIVVCAFLFALPSIGGGDWDWDKLSNSAQSGATIGFLISLLGIGDIVTLFYMGRFTTFLFRALGYIAIWSAIFGAYSYWN